MRAGPTVFPAQAAAVEQETDKLVGFPITNPRLLYTVALSEARHRR